MWILFSEFGSSTESFGEGNKSSRADIDGHQSNSHKMLKISSQITAYWVIFKRIKYKHIKKCAYIKNPDYYRRVDRNIANKQLEIRGITITFLIEGYEIKRIIIKYPFQIARNYGNYQTHPRHIRFS